MSNRINMASTWGSKTSHRPATNNARDRDGGEKSKVKKRKLADMLGPPWSEDDLEIFYQAFRRHGKDWKKVSGSMRKRTVEMVEALYCINKAYLSLPEGTASAAGLIAMMTDHYNLLDGSRSQGEETSGDVGGSDGRSNHIVPAKIERGIKSLGLETSSSHLNVLVGPACFGGPSPAKKPRTIRSQAVGKRAPHIPTGSTLGKRGRTNRVTIGKLHDNVDANIKCDVAAAQTLVSKLSGLTHISNAPPRRSFRQSIVQQYGEKESLLSRESHALEKPMASTSNTDLQAEGSSDSKELQCEDVTKASSSNSSSGESGGDGKSSSKLGKSSRKLNLQLLHTKPDFTNLWDKTKKNVKDLMAVTEKQGSGTEVTAYASNQVLSRQWRRRPVSPFLRPKKRSRQLFSGDCNSGLDALATLAASSLSGLEPGLEHGESLNVVANAAASFGDKEEVESKSTIQNNPKDKESKFSMPPQPLEVKLPSEIGSREGQGVDKPGDKGGALELRQPSSSPGKQNFSSEKVLNVDGAATDGDPVVPLKPRNKVNRQEGSKILPTIQGFPKQQSEAIMKVRGTGSQIVEVLDWACEYVTDIDGGSLPLKLRSKKKGIPEKSSGEQIDSANASLCGVPPLLKHTREPACCSHTTPDPGPASSKAILIHCLCQKVRRWCMCEWFYSAIDLPWFARNEFVEYLKHAGLGHVPRLTRVEWGVIRGSLGKPRRLSRHFLEEERVKLARYRESVRALYHDLRTGAKVGLPTDLARPLTVGQRVVALHPKTYELHDGSILTVDRCRCRVQFDRPELGVELVMDIDAMPIHPIDNMPEVMRQCRVYGEGFDHTLVEYPKLDLKLRSWSKSGGVGGAARAALNEQLEQRFTLLSQRFLLDLPKRAQVNILDGNRGTKEVMNRAVFKAMEGTFKTAAAAQRVALHQSYSVVQSQAREADARALTELSGSLDKKEALVLELRQMNDEASGNVDGFRTSEVFQRQYATIVLQLKEVNKQVTNGLLQLRQRNKYHDNAIPPWYRSNFKGTWGLGSPDVAGSGELWPSDTSPAPAEMTELAVKHAKLMVTTAVKAIDGLKAGDDALQKLGYALEAIPNAESVSASLLLPALAAQGISVTGGQPGSLVSSSSLVQENNEADIGTGTISSRPPVNGPLTRRSTLEAVAHDLVQHVSQTACVANGKEAINLTELMTSCVATLFLLQTLSNMSFSITDIQQSLDSSLMSLRPKSAKNKCVYEEIEQQIAIVKTQITGYMSNCPNHTA